MKIIKQVIIIIVIALIISFVCDVSFVKDNHFNLITVNSVLVGFLFTSLSIMLSFLNEKIVQLFEKVGALKKVYNSISFGIECSIYSIIISLLNMVIFEKYIHSIRIVNFLFSLEFALLIIAICYLLITIKEVKIVVESIRFDNTNRKDKKQIDEEIKKIFSKIR